MDDDRVGRIALDATVDHRVTAQRSRRGCGGQGQGGHGLGTRAVHRSDTGPEVHEEGGVNLVKGVDMGYL